MKIDTVCILGGGTSGFMTSSMLAKYREESGLDFDIKLVHSETIGSIGVGESTLFNINYLFRYLELTDKDWMKPCNATYKTSVRFEDFYKHGTYFHYPFGSTREDADIQLWFTLKEVYPETFTPEKAALYFNPNSIFCEKNKLSDNVVSDGSGYHFDSYLLGEYLRKYSEKRGVEIVNDTFKSATLREDGYIKSLICENGTYEADLFIDCSGFRSLLLDGVMGEEYISFGDTLINNKALVTKVPYTDKEKQLKNYTNSVALKNGWCWETPLWDSLAYGYVHTNKFATEEEIEQEFFEHVGEVEYRTLHFKTGRYKRGWVKNVAAVGLSYGFLEPLEATGIATTLENIFRLLECISKRDMFYTQVDRDAFNHHIASETDGFRGFVESHYYLSSREDTEYWRHLTEDVDYGYDTMGFGYQEFLNRIIVRRDLTFNGSYPITGLLFVIAGMNYSCFSKAFTLSDCNPDDYFANAVIFNDHIKELEVSTEDHLSSYQYLKKKIYSRSILGVTI